MSDYKQCPNGHYYQGDHCPYCKPAPTVHQDYMETEMANIPICPHCGRPVRQGLPHPNFPIVGSIRGNAYDGEVPWNYRWNGQCEHCGYDFSITMTQKIGSSNHNDRQTIVRVSERHLPVISEDGYTFPDAFTGLSGVEIEQRNVVDGVRTTFVSTNELKYLINALKNSPLMKQLDWSEDTT